MAQHFNSAGHSITDVQVRGMRLCQGSIILRKQLEMRLILTLLNNYLLNYQHNLMYYNLIIHNYNHLIITFIYNLIIHYQECCLLGVSSFGLNGQDAWSCPRDRQALQSTALRASLEEAIIHKFSSTMLQSFSPL